MVSPAVDTLIAEASALSVSILEAVMDLWEQLQIKLVGNETTHAGLAYIASHFW